MSIFIQSQSLVQLDLPAIRIVGIFGTFFYSGFINPWEIGTIGALSFVGFAGMLQYNSWWVKVIQGDRT